MTDEGLAQAGSYIANSSLENIYLRLHIVHFRAYLGPDMFFNVSEPPGLDPPLLTSSYNFFADISLFVNCLKVIQHNLYVLLL